MLKKILLVALALASSSFPLHAAPESVPAPQLPIGIPGFNFKTTANFDDLRHNILELIGTGRKRVWVLTDYLTDGELASALFLAKYRNLDVKVYLGRGQLNASGSRLPYLRGQNVPVFLRPRHGFATPTLLFVDQRLYGFNRDLNTLQRLGSTEIIQASPADVKAFVSWMKDVMENPEIAYPRALRGRPSKDPFQGDSEGSYNYDRRSNWRKAPEGVTKELPKVPKWKQTEELRKRGPAPSEDPAPVVPGSEEVKKPATEEEMLKKPEPDNLERAVPVRPWDEAPLSPTDLTPKPGPSSP